MQTLKPLKCNSSCKSCHCSCCRSYTGSKWQEMTHLKLEFPHLYQVCVNTPPLSHTVAVKP